MSTINYINNIIINIFIDYIIILSIILRIIFITMPGQKLMYCPASLN